MAQIDDAKARLDNALARLEKALTGRLQHTGSDESSADEGRINALAAELSVVKGHNETLQKKTHDVSKRLNSAIVKLKSILED